MDMRVSLRMESREEGRSREMSEASRQSQKLELEIMKTSNDGRVMQGAISPILGLHSINLTPVLAVVDPQMYGQIPGPAPGMMFSPYPVGNPVMGVQQPYEFSSSMLPPGIQYNPTTQFIQGEMPQQIVYGTVQQPIGNYKSGAIDGVDQH
eukprot:765251-Hanusia_phi.AAC.4